MRDRDEAKLRKARRKMEKAARKAANIGEGV
jgi:hypothetical protein